MWNGGKKVNKRDVERAIKAKLDSLVAGFDDLALVVKEDLE